ncbi:MAG: apolipoprotein N-acyltransferase [Actinomycetota bacterium]
MQTRSSEPPFAERWRLRLRLPLAVLSGALLSLAFPPVDIRWFAFVGLIPLLLALRGAKVWEGGLLGGAWAITFFAITIHWVSVIDPVAWYAIVAMEIPLAIALGALSAALMRGGPIARIVLWPLMFTGWELLRGSWPLGGFTFGSLGSSQYSGLPLLPLARAGGMFAITLALCLINALLAESLTSRRAWTRITPVGAAMALAIFPVLLPLGAVGTTSKLDVAMIQGNVPQGYFRGLRMGSTIESERAGPRVPIIIANHVALTKSLKENPPQLVIWPENSLDRDPFVDPVARAGVAAALESTSSPLLAGAILNGPDDAHFYNADLLFAPDGSLLARYDKIHLVPFGEYVPWKWARRVVPTLREIGSDAIAGTKPVVMRAPGLPPIGPVICFESSYPELVANVVRAGAQVIVVSTNNASFERTALARQHLAQSVMRAVETGRPVLHAAIAGISAIISPDGKIIQRAGLFIPAILRETITATNGETPYVAYGRVIEESMEGGAAIAAIVAIILLFRRKLNAAAHQSEEDDFWQEHLDASPVEALRRGDDL